MQPTHWLSPVPDLDDFGNPIHDEFIDGATIHGPWALMTPTAHAAFGRGLGLGKGQRYKLDNATKLWTKVEG